VSELDVAAAAVWTGVSVLKAMGNVPTPSSGPNVEVVLFVRGTVLTGPKVEEWGTRSRKLRCLR